MGNHNVRNGSAALILAAGALAGLVAAPQHAVAATQRCGDLPTQTQMNQCAARQLAAANKRVSTVTTKVYDHEHGKQAKATFARNAKQWKSHRDAACKADAAAYTGGTLYPFVLDDCLTRADRARIAKLQKQL